MVKTVFLKIFEKKIIFLSRKYEKAREIDDCASNGTKIMPMRLTVQPVQNARTAADEGSGPASNFFSIFSKHEWQSFL
jgi:hypothetical protein